VPASEAEQGSGECGTAALAGFLRFDDCWRVERRMALLRGLLFVLAVPVIAIVLLLVGVMLLLLAPFLIASHHYRRITNRHPWHWFRARRGRGLRVEELARRLDMTAEELRGFSPRYREAVIAKRAGGQRRLLVPDKRTKALQRLLLHRVFRRLNVHYSAFGFQRGRSIVHNALPHVGQSVVVRLDVVDFFPSTRAERLERYFRRIGWNAEAAALLVALTTHDDGLPQGAPTSPRLSNLVNYRLDSQMLRLAERWKGHYTRYADDITFSFPKDYPRHVRGVIQSAQRILKAHGYQMHRRRKLHIRRRYQRQVVTGLVVNHHVNLSRDLRRLLRAVRHHLQTGRAATLTAAQLQGWNSLASMIREQSQVQ
jgi:retron-type reverse transcriptase